VKILVILKRELTREEIQKELRDLYNSYRIALMIER